MCNFVSKVSNGIKTNTNEYKRKPFLYNITKGKLKTEITFQVVEDSTVL